MNSDEADLREEDSEETKEIEGADEIGKATLQRREGMSTEAGNYALGEAVEPLGDGLFLGLGGFHGVVCLLRRLMALESSSMRSGLSSFAASMR